MSSSPQIWRDRIWLWLPALVLLVINLALAIFYQLTFSDEIAVSERRLREAQEHLEEVREGREVAESHLAKVEGTRERVTELYGEKFSTQKQNLTNIIREVKKLAAQAGMRPGSINYPEQALEGLGLVKQSFVFNVEGSYADLRKFIYTLELSDSFLSLEKVALSESSDRGAGGRLQISLSLSTLFTVESVEGESGTPLGVSSRRTAP
jgi:type IV pilus assembly protein PilO